MKHIIKLLGLWFCMASSLSAHAQVPVLSLDTVLQRIDNGNLPLQSYGLKASAYKYSAEAATAWMAPMVGALVRLHTLSRATQNRRYASET